MKHRQGDGLRDLTAVPIIYQMVKMSSKYPALSRLLCYAVFAMSRQILESLKYKTINISCTKDNKEKQAIVLG